MFVLVRCDDAPQPVRGQRKEITSRARPSGGKEDLQHCQTGQCSGLRSRERCHFQMVRARLSDATCYRLTLLKARPETYSTIQT
ncbi:MAG: hypothetical protein JWO94_178 [Verrucomicrobiaceae bacterium]|nr:hypothetical protein [Verrucomicrobiaceae bacterium]